MIDFLQDIAAAFQFLTRLPLNWLPYRGDTLRRSAKFFPLVGLALGSLAGAAHKLLLSHLPALLTALLVLLLLTLLTGGMHEDGLADVADAFGGGWSREKILEIMKDSRVGSYGALAIVFSFGSRLLLFGSLPPERFFAYAVAAETLSRYTVLPLGACLSSARPEASLGGRVARQISVWSLLIGALLALAPTAYLLRMEAIAPIAAVLLVTACTGFYYKRRLNGITGDCFGATIHLAAIAVYLCGVWRS